MRVEYLLRVVVRKGEVVWFVVMEIFSTLLEWVGVGRKSAVEKDLEILLLRRQLAIVERTLDKPIWPSRGEKLTLAMLAAKLKAGTGRTAKESGEIIRIAQPETVLKWHPSTPVDDHAPIEKLNASWYGSRVRMLIGGMA